MKLTIIIPFSRVQNLNFYIGLFEGFNFNAILVIDNKEILEKLPQLPENIEILFVENQPPETDVCYWKINQAIEKKVSDDTYYSILMDDDCVHQSIRDIEITKDITIISMKRGMKIPPTNNPINAHPTHTLIADPSNMKVGHIGAEQMIIKGSLLKTLHFNEKSPYADGEMAEYIYKNYQDIEYLPDIYILFNFLEKGRYE